LQEKCKLGKDLHHFAPQRLAIFGTKVETFHQKNALFGVIFFVSGDLKRLRNGQNGKICYAVAICRYRNKKNVF